MSDQKVSTGQKLKESPLRRARVVNLLLDAAGRHQRTELAAVSHPPRGQPLSTDLVIVQNITGAVRERGDVVQLGEYLCSGDPDIFDPWFEGKEPADPLWKCAILGEPAGEDGFARAHASGVCVAKVDVQSTSHTHASPVDGEYVLESGASGPFELFSQPDGTGEQLMAVRFDRSPPRGWLYARREGITPITIAQGDLLFPVSSPGGENVTRQGFEAVTAPIQGFRVMRTGIYMLHMGATMVWDPIPVDDGLSNRVYWVHFFTNDIGNIWHANYYRIVRPPGTTHEHTHGGTQQEKTHREILLLFEGDILNAKLTDTFGKPSPQMNNMFLTAELLSLGSSL